MEQIIKRTILATTAVILIAAQSVTTTATEVKKEFQLQYLSVYESNIFHSFADSLEVGDQMNDLTAELELSLRHSRRFRQDVTFDTDLNFYFDNSRRNRTALGVTYEPLLRYSSHGRLKLTGDLARSKKDLIDDAGEVQPRTLEKTVVKLGGDHYFKFGDFRTRQSIEYGNYNYDESLDEFGKPELSWDYDYVRLQVVVKYKASRQVRAGVEFETQKRNFDERKTLSLDKQSSRVRNYRTNTVEFEIEVIPISWAELSATTEFSRRNENFENFYGYDQWKHSIKAELTPHHRHLTELSLYYRAKDYENYWTSRIGLLNRVDIDYAVLEIEHAYRISNLVSFLLYLRNFNKVSNDIDFDYRDFFLGTGIRIEL